MSRFKLIIIFFLLSSCCKETEVIKQIENKNFTFSLYSSLYKENVTIHKKASKLNRIVYNNKSNFDNLEYFSSDSLQTVWANGINNTLSFKFKDIKTKDTLVMTNSYDTATYIFANNILKKIIMPYGYTYIVNSYSNTQVDVTLVRGINQLKEADYLIILDTASFQDYYTESYYNILPPLNYLRYYTEFYKLNFPNLSYKSVSIKSYSVLRASEEISIKNQFDSLSRLKQSFILRKNYPISNDTLTFNYFD